MQSVKYIVVSGGLMSGTGKGIVASSIATLLSWSGFVVSVLKIDGYLNVDPGTMSPGEHGECYVTADGGEVDLDLGNYERFIGVVLGKINSMTMGKVYSQVIAKERAGEYNGRTVQVVPHVTDAIQDWVRNVAESPISLDGQPTQLPQICIIEVGGTIGDIENQAAYEAIRQFSFTEDVCFVHLCPMSYISSSDGGFEEKTKPTQNSVKALRAIGLEPDILVMRCKRSMAPETRQKLKMFSHAKHIFSSHEVPNIHYVPKMFMEQGVHVAICKIFGISLGGLPMRVPKSYNQLLGYFDGEQAADLCIAVVIKYNDINDAYLSITRAIQHAAFSLGKYVMIELINAETLETRSVDLDKIFHKANGILVPGGFGTRGIPGMRLAAQWAKERDIPYFGICLGMQVLVSTVERHPEYQEKWVDRLDSGSAEWVEEVDQMYDYMIEILPGEAQKSIGGTMRLGNYSCEIKNGTLAHRCYGVGLAEERHRHRYEVSTPGNRALEDCGFEVSGKHHLSDETYLTEIIELPGKRFCLGCQFHPEYRSRYWRPHPLFVGFMQAMIE